jgi:hypothetical protein
MNAATFRGELGLLSARSGALSQPSAPLRLACLQAEGLKPPRRLASPRTRVYEKPRGTPLKSKKGEGLNGACCRTHCFGCFSRARVYKRPGGTPLKSKRREGLKDLRVRSSHSSLGSARPSIRKRGHPLKAKKGEGLKTPPDLSAGRLPVARARVYRGVPRSQRSLLDVHGC